MSNIIKFPGSKGKKPKNNKPLTEILEEEFTKLFFLEEERAEISMTSPIESPTKKEQERNPKKPLITLSLLLLSAVFFSIPFQLDCER